MDRLIIVIDDSPTICKIVEVALQREGYPVKSFSDGLQALSWLKIPQSPIPALIFLDLIMPKISGYQVARYLKEKPQFVNTTIVMLTRQSGIIERLKARLAGAKTYLTKPVEARTLIQVVHTYVGSTDVAHADEELLIEKNCEPPFSFPNW